MPIDALPSPSSPAGARLTDFVRVFSGALDADLCAALIQRFDAAPRQDAVAAADGSPIFRQVVMTGVPEWRDLHDQVVNRFAAVVDAYRAGFHDDWLPAETGWEQLRIKGYRPGTGEHFPLHVDVVNEATARRALAFFAYLDDVDEGGETIFPTLGVGIKPQRGNVLVFPPLWLYPHEAKPPVSGPKHIVHSYLHYL